MMVESATIPGVRFLQPELHHDDRGCFAETWRQAWTPFFRPLQANCSVTNEGTLRGLHVHTRQADLWRAVGGRAVALLVDMRGVCLAEMPIDRPRQLVIFTNDGIYIPPGVAHGFYALSSTTLTYMVDQPYDGSDEHGVRWDLDDPRHGPEAWGLAPGAVPRMSERDRDPRPLSRTVVHQLANMERC